MKHVNTNDMPNYEKSDALYYLMLLKKKNVELLKVQYAQTRKIEEISEKGGNKLAINIHKSVILSCTIDALKK